MQDVFLSDRNAEAITIPSKKSLAQPGVRYRKFATHFRMKKLSGRPALTAGKRIKKIDAPFTDEGSRQIEKMELALGLKKRSGSFAAAGCFSRCIDQFKRTDPLNLQSLNSMIKLRL